MKRQLRFTITGGDSRMSWAGAFLEEQGHRLLPWPCEEFTHMLLPMPGPGDPASLLSRLGPGKTLLGARLGAVAPELEKTGTRILDYYTHEPFIAGNAVITAEGALSLAMEAGPGTLWGSRVLVCGWGRIGQLLAHRLVALGAEVTVSARKAKDRGLIEAMGMNAIDSGDCSVLGRMEFIFNTVPAPVYCARELAETPPGSFLLELASAPGLEDSPERPVTDGRGLPGRYGPRAAGRLLGQTVLELVERTQA